MQFMTMICDIKKSKELKNREEVQYKLIDTLKEANSLFSSIIASPFIITIGDEWEGLLYFPCDFYRVLDFFRSRLGSIEFYCGIGVGDVSIHNFELTVNQLDGPTFHRARKAISLAKEMGSSLVLIQ
ncbi:SatD family protein [Fonticella tunisiensis]|uniref:SatD family protein n=2 Tax=Fonticella tunisiensis TaxID=1096341 RepID=A0A4R7KVB1_9CLOT|nr:SatD family protein [Fonticella tunisiensis]